MRGIFFLLYTLTQQALLVTSLYRTIFLSVFGEKFDLLNWTVLFEKKEFCSTEVATSMGRLVGTDFFLLFLRRKLTGSSKVEEKIKFFSMAKKGARFLTTKSTV